jgi:hypothetical protein
MSKVVYLFLLFLSLSVMAQGQSKNKNQTSKGDSYNYRSAYNTKPSKKEVRKAKKAYKSSYARQFDVKIKEYEDRMQANAKKYKKISQIADKPQYSDPAYFGHKKKPRKRKPGKKKFCKECQIVH